MKRTKFFLIPTKGRDTTNSAKRESEPVVEPDNPLTGSMGLAVLATYSTHSLEAVLATAAKRNEEAIFNTGFF